MSPERLRVGIIGASVNAMWGPRAHVPAVQALPEFELAAVCTAHPETAAESAASSARASPSATTASLSTTPMSTSSPSPFASPPITAPPWTP